jgi:hypothetical protein
MFSGRACPPMRTGIDDHHPGQARPLNVSLPIASPPKIPYIPSPASNAVFLN